VEWDQLLQLLELRVRLRPGAHGQWGKALFANAASGDFHLAAGSPGIDRGAVLPGFNDPDSAWPSRGAPDMGAFES